MFIDATRLICAIVPKGQADNCSIPFYQTEQNDTDYVTNPVFII